MSVQRFTPDTDELERRSRSLAAERLRPEKQVTTDDLLGELVHALALLYRTPPDVPRAVDKSLAGQRKDLKGAA